MESESPEAKRRCTESCSSEPVTKKYYELAVPLTFRLVVAIPKSTGAADEFVKVKGFMMKRLDVGGAPLMVQRMLVETHARQMRVDMHKPGQMCEVCAWLLKWMLELKDIVLPMEGDGSDKLSQLLHQKGYFDLDVEMCAENGSFQYGLLVFVFDA